MGIVHSEIGLKHFEASLKHSRRLAPSNLRLACSAQRGSLTSERGPKLLTAQTARCKGCESSSVLLPHVMVIVLFLKVAKINCHCQSFAHFGLRGVVAVTGGGEASEQ